MTLLTDQLSILLPALLAGILVLITHIPLGQEVLRRGIIFLDLAIAQIASLGVIVAQTIIQYFHFHSAEPSEDEPVLLIQLVALITAVGGATILYAVRKLSAKIQEALIGILFVLAATGGILLMAYDPHASDRLKDILTGQILWVSYSQLLWTGVIYTAVLFCWFRLKDQLGEFGFYPLFAITITLSTQLVGVYLVFASLIIPALVALNANRSYTTASLIGLLGYVVGIVLSAILDLPTGPVTVWALALISLIYFFTFKPTK